MERPKISSVVKTASGFQVQLVGFSNPRELDEVRLHFTPVSGQTLQTTDLKLDLTVTANNWYTSAAATPFGSQFLLVLPFTVHSAGDYLAAALLLGAPWALNFADGDGGLAAFYVVAGVAVLAVSLITNYQYSPKREWGTAKAAASPA